MQGERAGKVGQEPNQKIHRTQRALPVILIVIHKGKDMKWQDEQRNGKITASTRRIGPFKLSVHHYIGCGDAWFMSCYGIFDKHELGEISLNDAKVMATARLQIKLEEAIKEITG
ncbi:MAG: hypothetical protein SV375_17030 [Thermodesulfobacteriota bacterium]|nr:hypothetical protein [Thermodesulfobacteriota bacterium]